MGVDGMSPFFAKLLPNLASNAVFVSAEPALRQARALKSDDEMQCLRIATRIAAEAIAGAANALLPGTTPRELRAVAMERMTAFGATIPGHDGLFAVLPRDPATPLDRLDADVPIRAGDHVALAASVTFAGYEGNFGRTFLCSDDQAETRVFARLQDFLAAQWRELSAKLAPGTPFSEIVGHLAAARGEGASFIAIEGVGIGMEPPLLHSARAAITGLDAVLRAGMTLAVKAHLCTHEFGNIYWSETVAITDGGCEMLSGTDSAHGNSGNGRAS